MRSINIRAAMLALGLLAGAYWLRHVPRVIQSGYPAAGYAIRAGGQ